MQFERTVSTKLMYKVLFPEELQGDKQMKKDMKNSFILAVLNDSNSVASVHILEANKQRQNFTTGALQFVVEQYSVCFAIRHYSLV